MLIVTAVKILAIRKFMQYPFFVGLKTVVDA